MSDPIPDPITGESAVKNLAPKPPGIFPKNAQTIAIAGISLVMVLVIALSGGPSSRPTSSAAQPKSQQVIDPNAARIAEYRNRIEEQTRRLAAEQAQLNQAKQAFGGEVVPGAVVTQQPPYAAPSSIQAAPTPVVDEKVRLQEQLEAAERKREYDSLFASNVALTLRREAAAQVVPPPAIPATTVSAPKLPPPTEKPKPSAPLPTELLKPAIDGEVPLQSQPRQNRKGASVLQQATGRQFRLFEGTIMETVLTNRLTGSLAGPVNCMVTTDVYSHDRQHLLIPKGSRVLGEVAQVSSFGQQRLAVSFHRIVMPDGFSVDLDQFRGLNQIGETGLRDQVDRHYRQTFGISLAIGAIAGLSQVNTRAGFDASGTDLYRQGVATSLSQSALRILDRYLNILPTFTIREGHRIKIYLADDLLLPAYAGHRLPGDL